MAEIVSSIALFTLVFLATMNPSICENAVNIDIEKPVDNCYFHLATLKNQFLICNSVQDSLLKNECYSELAKYVNDPKECENIKKTKSDSSAYFHDKTTCYTSVALYTKNSSWCSFAGPKDETECKNAVLGEPTIPGEDVNLNLDRCKERIAFYRNGCLVQLAKQEKDEQMCDALLAGPVDYKLLCQDDIARVKLDESNCKSIFCLKEIAMAKNNLSLCDKISNQEYVVNIAELSYDTSYSNETEWRELTSNECFDTIITNLTLELLNNLTKITNNESFLIAVNEEPLLAHAVLQFYADQLKGVWGNKKPYELIYSILSEENSSSPYRDVLLIDFVGLYSWRQEMDIYTSRKFIALFEDSLKNEKYPLLPKVSILNELTSIHITSEELKYINYIEIGHYKFFLNSLVNENNNPEFSTRLQAEINQINEFYPNVSAINPDEGKTVPK